MATTVRIGPARGRILLRTGRQGVAAQAGHDLVIEVVRWSGELVVADVLAESAVTVTAETGSLSVLGGTGGSRPLSEQDKLEVATTARRLLESDHRPEVTSTTTKVTAGEDDDGAGGVVDGVLTVCGTARPFRLTVDHSSEKLFRATGTIKQTDYGIKPCTAFFGALRPADPVAVEAELDVS